ncbi:agamous-like MADS-box protein AGL29 [Benincasa hispida]|uniref:agamous-like MADS-box protein AGL29 n=1 Tax=Benincasa hispida TaxID=102211 RepID=UPI001901F09F|nr:agamous-like MADS-box protein AGL29 [Benincasa hispida]
MGRRKIDMKMVKDRGCRQVTFSKRRNGLFKKANDLATLCGLEIAIVVFSPGGKAFSFGNPNVEDVIDRYLNREPEAIRIPAVRENGMTKKKNEELIDLVKQLQMEKKKGEMMEKEMKSRGELMKIEDLDLDELLKLKESLEKLRKNVKIEESEVEALSSLLLLAKEPVMEADESNS